MGGGVWQDNLDRTFTQLDDYYIPVIGFVPSESDILRSAPAALR